jgi:hypothetical protein
VEQVTGRLSYPKVAGQGALNGMVFGAFLGMIMSLLGGEQWVSSLLVSVLLGGAFWMLLATVTYATQRGKRDFTSTNQIVATSYDVVAAPEVSQRARQVLQGLHGVPVLPAQAPAPHAGPGGPAAPGAPWRRPSYGAPGQQPAPGAVPGARPAEPPMRSATFQDLPDGRPQSGIRLDEEETAPGAPQPAGAPGAPRPAGAPEAQEAPESRAPGQEPPAGGSTSASR